MSGRKKENKVFYQHCRYKTCHGRYFLYTLKCFKVYLNNKKTRPKTAKRFETQCLTRQVFLSSVKKIILLFFDKMVFEDV